MLIEFTQPVRVCEISIRFQGGFVGKECILQGGEIDELIRFFPEDSSTLQVSSIDDKQVYHYYNKAMMYYIEYIYHYITP